VISVLVLTLDEEVNLRACLESLSWSNDVVVLDSFSSDRTLEIAGEFGARVVQRRFDNWASHQNWALDNIVFTNSWVYYSDADEVMPSDLRDEVLSRATHSAHASAFRLRYKNFFWGRWIRHCGIYPVWVLRLFRPEKIRWERVVNPIPVVEGVVADLECHFHHFSFNKGLDAWFEKHNRYSNGEALETLKSLRSGSFRIADVFAVDRVQRRRALKELSFRLPARFLLRFIYMYVLKRGFLDGLPGLRYCCLLSIYEYMISIKVAELLRCEAGLRI